MTLLGSSNSIYKIAGSSKKRWKDWKRSIKVTFGPPEGMEQRLVSERRVLPCFVMVPWQNRRNGISILGWKCYKDLIGIDAEEDVEKCSLSSVVIVCVPCSLLTLSPCTNVLDQTHSWYTSKVAANTWNWPWKNKTKSLWNLLNILLIIFWYRRHQLADEADEEKKGLMSVVPFAHVESEEAKSSRGLNHRSLELAPCLGSEPPVPPPHPSEAHLLLALQRVEFFLPVAGTKASRSDPPPSLSPLHPASIPLSRLQIGLSCARRKPIAPLKSHVGSPSADNEDPAAEPLTSFSFISGARLAVTFHRTATRLSESSSSMFHLLQVFEGFWGSLFFIKKQCLETGLQSFYKIEQLDHDQKWCHLVSLLRSKLQI